MVAATVGLGTATYVAASPPANADGAGDVIWSWNGVDVTQFGDGLGAPVVGDTFGTITGSLSVVTPSELIDAAIKPTLRYTHTGGAGTPCAFYRINDLPVMPDKYLIECKLGPRDLAPLGDNTSPRVLMVYQDATHYVALNRTSTPSTLALDTGNGNNGITVGSRSVATLTNSTPNVTEGEELRVYVDLREATAITDPGMRLHARTIGDAITLRASQANWSSFGGGINPNTTWHAGWRTGGDHKRVGIAFIEIVATAGHGYISDLRIRNFSML
jgi:hypothetical protein